MRKLLTVIILLLVFNTDALGQINCANKIPAVAPAFWWRNSTSDSLWNFNNATTVSNGDSIVFDSLPYSKDYTMVVVYKAKDSIAANVWRMEYEDSTSTNKRGLTTERIISDSTAIRYTEHTTMSPVINTLRQSAPHSTSRYTRLVLGGDTLPGSITIAEVMYFDKRLSNSMLRRVQSALAVRYGVTLGPVDYVDGGGSPIWEYADSGLYHHRITGIGCDSTYNIYQTGSRSEMDGAILTIATDSIAEHDFLVIGDNDYPLSFVEDGDGVEILSRRWRVRATGMESNSYTLAFDTRNISLPTDSLVLLMGGYVILPTLSNASMVRFGNVWLPSDTCTFTLARGALLWQLAQSNSHGGKGGKGSPIQEDGVTYDMPKAKFNIFPNPTTGHYSIEVSGAKHVQVVIYNVYGSVVDRYSGEGEDHYIFNGELPSGNTYYATVTTESGSQTMKLVVK